MGVKVFADAVLFYFVGQIFGKKGGCSATDM